MEDSKEEEKSEKSLTGLFKFIAGGGHIVLDSRHLLDYIDYDTDQTKCLTRV